MIAMSAGVREHGVRLEHGRQPDRSEYFSAVRHDTGRERRLVFGPPHSTVSGPEAPFSFFRGPLEGASPRLLVPFFVPTSSTLQQNSHPRDQTFTLDPPHLACPSPRQFKGTPHRTTGPMTGTSFPRPAAKGRRRPKTSDGLGRAGRRHREGGRRDGHSRTAGPNRTRLVDRPFPCVNPGCGRAFPTSRGEARHRGYCKPSGVSRSRPS